MEAKFAAWEEYLTKALLINRDYVVVTHDSELFHYKDCIQLHALYTPARSADTWEDMRGRIHCGMCLGWQAIRVETICDVLFPVKEAVLTAETGSEQVALAFYALLEAECRILTWDCWTEDFATFSILYAALLQALGVASIDYFAEDDSLAAWQKPGQYLFAFKPETHAFALNAKGRASTAAALARGFVASKEGVWLIRAPYKITADLFHTLPQQITLDPGETDPVFWETVMAFLVDGLGVQDAVATAQSLK